ncbi:MAG: mannose-6-phosphate isomerase, class I [Propionicimonas sp.]
MARITNTPRNYAWGAKGRISRFLGWASSDQPEAELWFGSHPVSPSLAAEPGSTSWHDLRDWERSSGEKLPFLLKLLAADSPLSLQAHPNAAQARTGYERENSLNLPLDHPTRNYKDPHAKPELIVAVEDGFEALCGFREPAAILADLDELTAAGVRSSASFRELLSGSEPPQAAITWALSDSPEAGEFVDSLTALAHGESRWELLSRIAQAYPGDAGLIVTLTMNHVVLKAGEALWLPAGNIHAYLRGIGVELMGPSDNVLRGGLTPKHVDVVELTRVLDFSPTPPSRLAAEPIGPNAVTYRPASQPSGKGIPFQLMKVTGEIAFDLDGPAIALSQTGGHALTLEGETLALARGQAAFIQDAGRLSITGRGLLYLAVGSGGVPALRSPARADHIDEETTR